LPGEESSGNPAFFSRHLKASEKEKAMLNKEKVMLSRKEMRRTRAWQARRTKRLKRCLVEFLILLAVLLPLSAWGTSYDWTGSKNNKWDDKNSWGGASYPGNGTSYTDQATINNSTNNPALLANTKIILLGGATDVLTIGSSAGTSALQIGDPSGLKTGLLGTRGGISNAKTITITSYGTLRNDATSSATHYSIHGSGSITMDGGTISSNAGGIWDFNQNVSGYGTISAPVYNYSTVTANNISNSLGITGAFTNESTGTLQANSGATLAFSGSGSLSNSGTLNVYGTVSNTTASLLALTGTGNAYLYGGTLSGAGGFSNAHLLSGYGYVTAALTNTGTVTASGGDSGTPRALQFTGDVTNTGGIMNTNGAYNTLDLRSLITGGNINPNGGEVDLNGATLDGTTLQAGTVKVVSGSNKLTGTTDSYATIGINSGQTLSLASTLNNYATINVGSGFLDNSGTGDATLGGGGAVTLAGGYITSTGTHAFISDNAISGYGTISAPLNNNGTLTATGAGQTLTISGKLGGSGDVVVGSNASDTVTLDLKNDLDPGNLTMNQASTLAMSDGTKTIALTGNLSFSQTDPSQWPSDGFDLVMNGSGTHANPQTLEVGGHDYGVSMEGFTDNFHLASLTVESGTYVLLTDLFDNASPGPEALYVDSLYVADGGTLDFDNLNLYALYLGNPTQVLFQDSRFGPGDIVPVPASALLLGSGLLGLGLLRFRRREKKA
jgi:hypothetical protein